MMQKNDFKQRLITNYSRLKEVTLTIKVLMHYSFINHDISAINDLRIYLRI